MGENIQDKRQENQQRDKGQKEQRETDLQNKGQQGDNVSGSMAVLHTLQVTEGMEELYRHKEVLAIILKGVVREYESYSFL